MNEKAKLNADIFWHKLNKVKQIDGRVTMSPEQFRNMLTQAVAHGYDAGVEDGAESLKRLDKWRDASKEQSNPLSDLFKRI